MPFHHFHRLTVALSLAATSLLQADALQVSPLTKSQQLPLSKSDRAAQEVNLGWIPSELAGEGLKWMGLEGEVPSWDDLRGQIIVLQSFRAPSPQIKKVREAIEGLGTSDVLFLPVHTPDRSERFDEEKRSSVGLDSIPVLVDTHGELCDRFGFRRKTTNVIVDRRGVVAAVGVRTEALPDLLKEMIAVDKEKALESKPEKRSAPKASDYPPHNSQVGSATNRQGEDAPEFSVAQWVGKRPDMKNKTVVIDFWATWCGPCRAAIPHMNELQQTFAEDLVCVGVSNESADAFKQGMSSRQLNKPNTFAYALALDPSARMQRHFGVRGIPHCVVISPDGKVRWQGHPSGLDSGKLGAIVKAGRGAGATFEPFWTKNKR